MNATTQEPALDLHTDAIPQSEAGEREACYLIRKHGMFYRPNAQGYTNSVAEAGRYTLEDAIAYSHPNGPDGPRDGITYAHESEWFAQTEGSGLAEIAEFLIDQRHEPDMFGLSYDRVHYWRDKAIEAARRLTALQGAAQ